MKVYEVDASNPIMKVYLDFLETVREIINY